MDYNSYRGLKDPIANEGPWALENRTAADLDGGGRYYSTRKLPVLGIVLHITAGLTDTVGEDTSAESTARYGSTTTVPASWHVVVDSDSIVPCLQDRRTAWHAGAVGYNFNSPTLGIEIGLKSTDWRTLPDEHVEKILRNVAVWAAPRCIQYGIPLVLRRDRDEVQSFINLKKPFGFAYHADLSPTTRTDPGLVGASRVDTFPLERFWAILAEEIAVRRGVPPVTTPVVNTTINKDTTQPQNKLVGSFKLPKGHYYGLNDFTLYSHSGVRATDRPAIKMIQKRVGVKQDGFFGARTHAAVVQTQRASGLKADGKVGPLTWDRWN